MKAKLTLALLVLIVTISTGGCHQGGNVVTPADHLAASDPDSKATQLLKEFSALDIDEKTSWVQKHSFDLMVFEKVKDPSLLAKFNSDLKPLMAK